MHCSMVSSWWLVRSNRISQQLCYTDRTHSSFSGKEKDVCKGHTPDDHHHSHDASGNHLMAERTLGQ